MAGSGWSLTMGRRHNGRNKFPAAASAVAEPHTGPQTQERTAMASPHLFEPLQVGGLRLDNRIVIAPMCQYSAVDGCMTDWHMHAPGPPRSFRRRAFDDRGYGGVAGGPHHLWRRRALFRRQRSGDGSRPRRHPAMVPIPIAVQLAHAGRKASTELPWKGGAQIRPESPHGWRTVAPSPLPLNSGDAAPHGA